MIFTQEAPLTEVVFREVLHPDRIGIWKCWRGENQSTRTKTSRSRVENQQQTQPTYDVESGNRTRATLIPLLPQSQICTNPTNTEVLLCVSHLCQESRCFQGLMELILEFGTNSRIFNPLNPKINFNSHSPTHFL